jgi:hypothetical protein
MGYESGGSSLQSAKVIPLFINSYVLANKFYFFYIRITGSGIAAFGRPNTIVQVRKPFVRWNGFPFSMILHKKDRSENPPVPLRLGLPGDDDRIRQLTD